MKKEAAEWNIQRINFEHQVKGLSGRAEKAETTLNVRYLLNEGDSPSTTCSIACRAVSVVGTHQMTELGGHREGRENSERALLSHLCMHQVKELGGRAEKADTTLNVRCLLIRMGVEMCHPPSSPCMRQVNELGGRAEKAETTLNVRCLLMRMGGEMCHPSSPCLYQVNELGGRAEKAETTLNVRCLLMRMCVEMCHPF